MTTRPTTAITMRLLLLGAGSRGAGCAGGSLFSGSVAVAMVESRVRESGAGLRRGGGQSRVRDDALRARQRHA